MDCDSCLLTIRTQKIEKDIQYFEDFFDFGNLSEDQELNSNKNKKRLGKFGIEPPKSNMIDEFFSLRTKT